MKHKSGVNHIKIEQNIFIVTLCATLILIIAKDSTPTTIKEYIHFLKNVISFIGLAPQLSYDRCNTILKGLCSNFK